MPNLRAEQPLRLVSAVITCNLREPGTRNQRLAADDIRSAAGDGAYRWSAATSLASWRATIRSASCMP
jgi:hypothetical protein